MNDESILTTVKKMLGIPAEHTFYDQDIIVFINSVFMGLPQMGIGPEVPVVITSDEITWSDVFPEINDLSALIGYVYLKVRTVFDPPNSSTVANAFDKTMSEYEWRLMLEAEKLQ